MSGSHERSKAEPILRGHAHELVNREAANESSVGARRMSTVALYHIARRHRRELGACCWNGQQPPARYRLTVRRRRVDIPGIAVCDEVAVTLRGREVLAGEIRTVALRDAI